MQQAAAALREEEFEDVASVATARRAPLDTAENVLRPDFAKLTPGGHKPQLAAALDAVVKAADTIKAVQDRAHAKEAEHRQTIAALTVQLQDCEARAEAERARAETAEANIVAITERAAERLEDAQARIAQSQDETRMQTERAEAAERRGDEAVRHGEEQAVAFAGRIAESQDETRVQTERAEAAERHAAESAAEFADRLQEAQDRIFAAETRAIEAREDLAYLENHIRERFGI